MVYLRALRDRGVRLFVGCPVVPDYAEQVGQYVEIPFKKNMSPSANLSAMKLIRALVSSEGIDLVLTHTTLGAFFTRLALKGMKNRPYVLYIVQGYLFDRKTKWLKRTALLLAEKLVRAQTDMLITMNEEDGNIAAQYRLCKHLDTVPGMGVDFAPLKHSSPEEAAALRRQFGIPEDSFVLIYAAEFSKRKSQKVLIDAMERLPEKAVLALVGGGLTEEECRAHVKEKGLEGRVFFPGFYRDMAPIYSIADAAVSASRSEGLPFNVMECMHMGLPFVASRVKGHTDLIENGENGLLYEYGDVEGLAECIGRLLDSPELRNKFAANAVPSVEQYGLEQVFPVVMGKYERAMENTKNLNE